jgi:tRNA threonylcarbamoyladenosine biosynthesis protein TsaE
VRPRLAPYDPGWPERYELESLRIAKALGDDVVEIAHIGSTAVEGLAGKPTIDIAVGVTRLELDDEAVRRLALLGYEDARPESPPDELRFRRGVIVPREVIVHVVEWGGPKWQSHLGFRDALRGDPDLRAEYEALKRRLLAERGEWYSGIDKEDLIRRALETAPASVWLISGSADETEEVASRLAARLAPGDVVTVAGELGTGKTTFVRGAGRALGVEQPVTSPTFTIGHRYRGRVEVSHLDLYRFSALTPAEWGDLEPYFDEAVVFVEWPEVADAMLPKPRARVELGHLDDARRRIRVAATDAALLEGLVSADPGVRHGH